jgi:hypothetical protein
VVVSELFRKFQHDNQIGDQFQRAAEKIYDKVISMVFSRKCEHTALLVRDFRNLFVRIVNCAVTPEHFKTRMKFKVVDAIKKVISKGVNLECFYSYRIMEALLQMWSENELANELENGRLMEEPEFVGWVKVVLSFKSLGSMAHGNMKAANKVNFASLIVRTIIKFEENYETNSTVLKNSIGQSQKYAKKLFDEIMLPKKTPHIQDPEYSSGQQDCS